MRFPRFFEKANPVAKFMIETRLPTFGWDRRSYRDLVEEGFEQNVIAYHCITQMAKAASGVKLCVYRNDKYVSDSDLNALLSAPNPNDDRISFWEVFWTYYLISGRSFVIAGEGYGNKIKELWNVRPDLMNPSYDADTGIITGYVFANGNGTQKYEKESDGFIPVMMLNRPNPWRESEPHSALSSAGYSVDVHNEISKWSKSTMKNGMKPPGAFVMQKGKDGDAGRLDDSQYMRLKSEIDQHWTGSKNAGRPLILEGGLDWRQMSISPGEMDYINNRQDMAREICLAYNYPPLLMGLPGDNTFTNYAEARMALYEDTVIPMVQKLCEKLNMWLTRRFGPGFEIRLDMDSIPALAPKRVAVFKMANEAAFLSFNEKRKLLGYDADPNGDVILVDAGKVALGSGTAGDLQKMLDAGIELKEAIAILREMENGEYAEE